MWYLLIRITICIILFFIVLILLRKRRIIKKGYSLIFVVLSFVTITTLTYFIPIENLFINFSTPQEVFKYSTIGNLQKVIFGENSAMIMYSSGTGNDNSLQYIPRDNEGWKIGTSYSHSQVAVASNKDYYINIENIRDTDDFYVVIHESFAKNRKEIKDNQNSQFGYREVKNVRTDTYHYIYYAYVKNIDNNYTISIQGKDIPITFR